MTSSLGTEHTPPPGQNLSDLGFPQILILLLEATQGGLASFARSCDDSDQK